MKNTFKFLSLLVAAMTLTACCGTNDCCDPCPKPCAPKVCAPKPCARPCPRPCAPCPPPVCEQACY